MRLDNAKVLLWTSVSQGLALAAVMYAFIGIAVALAAAVAAIAANFFCLGLGSRYTDEDSPYLKLSEQIAMVGMLAMLPTMMLVGVLPGLLVVLVFAQFALNLQTHDYRRFYFGVIVSFVLVCAGAAHTRDGFYLLGFLLYGVSLAITLAQAHAVRYATDGRVPAHAGGIGRAAVMLVLSTLVVYLLVPRFPAGNIGGRAASSEFYRNNNWEQQAQNQQGNAREIARQQQARQDQRQREDDTGTSVPQPAGQADGENYYYRGFEDSFDIDKPNNQGGGVSNGIVAYMRADSGLYLRARIFDEFDGERWSTSATALTPFLVDRDGLHLDVQEVTGVETIREAYEIQIERNLGSYVPVAAQLAHIRFPGTVIGMDAFGQLRSPASLRAGTGYTAEAILHMRNQRVFAELTEPEPERFLQLPEALDTRITALASDVTAGAVSQQEMAMRLEQHLRENYDYDLTSVFRSQNRTPLSEFLFETRRGHCEYFASALAIMLRSQGIPARLVTGFSATNRNPLTGYYEIRALDGHAWVEAWVDNQGWMLLEPTAFYDGPMPEQGPLSAEQIDRYVAQRQRQSEALGEAQLSLTGVLIGLWQAVALLVTTVLALVKLAWLKAWPLLLALAVAVIGGVWLWRRYGNLWRAWCLAARVRQKAPADARQAQQFYLCAIDRLLVLRGKIRPAGQSIETFCQWLLDDIHMAVPASVGEEFNRVQYSDSAADVEAMQFRRLFFALYSGPPPVR